MDQIAAVLQKILDFNISPVILGGVAVVLELILRLVKSEKPLGIIHSISAIIRKISQLIGLLASVVGKLADLTDKVLPQKVADSSLVAKE